MNKYHFICNKQEWFLSIFLVYKKQLDEKHVCSFFILTHFSCIQLMSYFKLFTLSLSLFQSTQGWRKTWFCVIIIICLSWGWDPLLTHSGLMYPEVSLKVYHDSFCQLGSSISLPWVIYFEAYDFVFQHKLLTK